MRTSRVWEFKPCTLWQLKTKSASELHFVFIEGERSESVTSSWIHTRQKMSCSGQAPFSSDKKIASSSSQRSKPVRSLPDSLGFYSSGMAANLHSRSVTFPAVKGRAKEGETKKKISCLKSTTCATMVSWRSQVSWAVAGSPLLPNALQRRNKSPNQPWCWEKTFRSCFLSGDSVYYYITWSLPMKRSGAHIFPSHGAQSFSGALHRGCLWQRVITTNPKLLFLLLKNTFCCFAVNEYVFFHSP